MDPATKRGFCGVRAGPFARAVLRRARGGEVHLASARLEPVLALDDGGRADVLVSAMSAPASKYSSWIAREDVRPREREDIHVALEVGACRSNRAPR